MAELSDQNKNSEQGEGPLVLNLHSIIRNRLSAAQNRMVPGLLISALEKLIKQKELNEILRVTYPSRGSEFSAKVLKHLDIRVEVEGFDKLPPGRFMFVSNHPLGGLDGIALIALLGQKYGDENVRFIVNDMLMNVEPLKDVFLPINKFGNQGREATKIINEALESDKQILQFPAGLVSRLHNKGEIKDLEWKKTFVTQAIRHRRDIVPLKFNALNTKRFYSFAKWRKKLGIKINLEQALLPSEVCRSNGKVFHIIFGTPIPWQTLTESGKNPAKSAEEIRELVYRL